MKNFTLKFASIIVLTALVGLANLSQAQMPAAITMTPINATAYDDITLTFNPTLACFQNASLAGVPIVYMHSGLTIGGQTWQMVVDYSSTGANGQSPQLLPNPDGTYSITYNPAAFYGLEPGVIVTQICCVFNDGSWTSKDGRDFAPGSTDCQDFFIPLSYVSSDPKFSFRVNMNKMINDGNFDPIADDVYVTLDHGIEPVLLNPNPDFTYTGTIETGLDSGVVYAYKFRINQDVYETIDRTITAVPGTSSVDVWWNDEPINVVTFRVDMSYQKTLGTFNPDADFVDMAGDMNGWAGSDHMTRVAGTADSVYIYEVGYTLNMGQIYGYKFRINGDWATSEFPNGGPNRNFRGPAAPMTVTNVYDDYQPGTVPMTFSCNMSYQIKAGHFDPAIDYLDIAGNFNDWGGYDVCFQNNDSIFVIKKNVNVSYIGGSPVEFKFRFNGDWGTSEFPGGGPNRTYALLDTAGGVVNLYSCWYSNLDPSIPTPPWAYDLSIGGTLTVGQAILGVYTYEDVNGIPEGTSTYKWYRADDNTGTNIEEIAGATALNYTLADADVHKFIAFEVTPVAASGDSAVGVPVKTWTAEAVIGVGIQEVGNTFVSFYPNPVNNVLTFEHLGNINRIEMFNILGQQVLAVTNITSSTLTVSTSNLKTGVYFVKFFSGNNATATSKIIKN
jgi:hypothetical protein